MNDYVYPCNGWLCKKFTPGWLYSNCKYTKCTLWPFLWWKGQNLLKKVGAKIKIMDLSNILLLKCSNLLHGSQKLFGCLPDAYYMFSRQETMFYGQFIREKV